MTRIIYADSNYIAPRGVIVRPLNDHPALVEDALLERLPGGKRQYRWKTTPRTGRLYQRMIDFLRTNGPATVSEMIPALGERDSAIRYLLDKHTDRFEQCGERPSNINQWKSIGVWRLTPG